MRVSFRTVVQQSIALALLLVAPARAQDGERARVPFGVGERLEYDLKFGKLKVGVASMEVANVEEIRGHDAWHTVYQAHGGLRFVYTVDDVFESWIDRKTFHSLRFKKDQNEGRRDVEHTYEIYPERAEYTVGKDTAMKSVHDPLDDGSFLYFVRTIPLVVGETYSFDRYFMPSKNPVTIRVVRKDTIDVPAGHFSAIVIQPIIKTSGIFSENGHAEIWLSDDKNRIMLQMKSGLSFGSINLYLTSYRPAPAAQAAQTPVGQSGVFAEADLASVRTIQVAVRPNKVNAREFAHPPAADRSFGAFLDSLPDVLVARDFRAVVEAIASAARANRGVVVMLGGHIVKTGLAPVLIEMMRRGIVTHVAMNGAAAIHDYEIARFGATSEDVAAGLLDGTFGMAEETGREMNEAFIRGMRDEQGMGEVLGVTLADSTSLAYPDLSLLLAAYKLGVPVSVHAALGAEIIHQHPAASGAAIGDTSHRDFRRLAASLVRIDDGGVVLNLGSAVIMPEVFLKALTIARNLGAGRPQNFTTVDLDMQRHYRPRVNVVRRPTAMNGKGYEITGHHEIMVPLLVWSVLERLSAEG